MISYTSACCHPLGAFHSGYLVGPCMFHHDIIKWKHFPRYWSFVRGIHRSPVNAPHKGQWRGALIFSLICAWINGCVNSREAGDLRRHRTHYDVTVMFYCGIMSCNRSRHYWPFVRGKHRSSASKSELWIFCVAPSKLLTTMTFLWRHSNNITH